MSPAEQAIGNLRATLDRIAIGPVSSDQEDLVRRSLAEAWEHLPGSDEESTDAYKLHRAENLQWQPPILSFVLERHGGTVVGSSRAALHNWEADLNLRQARIVRLGRRQLTSQDERLNVKPLAEEVAKAIIKHRSKRWLNWKEANQVQIDIGELIPATNAQTTAGRRKRFHDALTTRLAVEGWAPSTNRWLFTKCVTGAASSIRV
jgi:hypothetical protein